MDKHEQKIAAFMELYRPVQHKLSAYCRVVAGNNQLAFDLAQDALTEAFYSFEKLRDTGSFLFFLYGIARNCYLKQQRRQRFFGQTSDIKPANIQFEANDIELQPDIELLYKAISKLNTEQRDVVLMFHIMGFSIADIAEDLKITEAAVKNRLVRGRDKLRQLLSDKESAKDERISANHIKTKAL